MNPQYESMTRVKVGAYWVRVWMPTRGVEMGPDRRVQAALERLTAFASPQDIAKALECFNPAAYEITRNGQGCVVYPDWG